MRQILLRRRLSRTRLSGAAHQNVAALSIGETRLKRRPELLADRIRKTRIGPGPNFGPKRPATERNEP
jgi:hypothetical protein